MSLRVGLDYIGKPPTYIERHVEENPYIGYKLKIYIVRNKWIIAAIYSVRVRDAFSFKSLSKITKNLSESVNVADDYSTELADLIDKILSETSTVVDGYTTETAGLTVKNLSEAVNITDDYDTDIADKVERNLDEIVSVIDDYSITTAALIIRGLAETVNVSDAYNTVIASKIVKLLEEAVSARELGVDEFPWEEDPSKILRVYYVFDKALGDDALTRLYEYVNEGESTLNEPVKVTDGYNTMTRVLRERNLPESASTVDDYTAITFSEWWLGIKYDGFVEAESIYNTVGIKYDGFMESSVTI